MEGDEWRGEEAEGEVRAELVADSGESHLQMNVEQGSCSSGSSLQSSMAGIASESTKILIHTLSKWCDQVHCCKLVIRSPLQLLDFLVLNKLQMYLKNKLRMNLLPILQYYYSNTNMGCKKEGRQLRKCTIRFYGIFMILSVFFSANVSGEGGGGFTKYYKKMFLEGFSSARKFGPNCFHSSSSKLFKFTP